MQIWLKGAKRFRFPVLPSEYKVTSEHGNESVNVNAIGEVDLGGKSGLRTVTFSSFFPKRYDSSYCEYSSRSPKACVDIIEKIKQGNPAKLIITGTSVNFRVRITSFEWSEEDGTGDIYFTLTMKEHRNVNIGSSRVIAVAG